MFLCSNVQIGMKYLLPGRSLRVKLLLLLLPLLPLEKGAPRMEALVVDEEEDASKKVRGQSWDGGQEEELVDGGEVVLRKDPGAFILHH